MSEPSYEVQITFTATCARNQVNNLHRDIIDQVTAFLDCLAAEKPYHFDTEHLALKVNYLYRRETETNP